MKPPQLESPTSSEPIPGYSVEIAGKAKITCTLFSNTSQVAAIKKDTSTILIISDNIN
jgi:hypothetical protein